MPYARLRSRNGFTYRKMVGDPYLAPTEAPWIRDADRMVTGEFNRLEQSYMGVYADLGDSLLDYGVRATGVDKEVIKRVMRWVLSLPEPDCPNCADWVQRTDERQLNQRCPRHEGAS
jgi:hypothetical protein